MVSKTTVWRFCVYVCVSVTERWGNSVATHLSGSHKDQEVKLRGGESDDLKQQESSFEPLLNCSKVPPPALVWAHFNMKPILFKISYIHTFWFKTHIKLINLNYKITGQL